MLHDFKNYRNRPLIYKNIEAHPDRLIAKYYVLTDLVDNMPADTSYYLDEAYTYWKRELKFCSDSHIVGLCKNPIQEILRRGYVEDQLIMGKVVEKYTDGKIEFFAFDSHDQAYFYEMIRKSS